jgi:hypothetical protein
MAHHETRVRLMRECRGKRAIATTANKIDHLDNIRFPSFLSCISLFLSFFAKL